MTVEPDREVHPPVMARPRDLIEWADELTAEANVFKALVNDAVISGGPVAEEVAKLRSRAAFLRRLAAAVMDDSEERKEN